LAAGGPARRRLEWLLAGVTIARGTLALLLGGALLLQREGTSETLATFMGLYWLIGGILTLAFEREIRALGVRRLPIVAGLFGVLAGGAVLIRGVIVQAQPSAEETFLLIGVLILVTGVTNVGAGVQTGSGPGRQRTREALVLGTLEVVLGVALIVSRGAPAAFLVIATMAWALAVGVVLLIHGLRMTRRLTTGPTDILQVG
jgi:uncharacterized membrane protein HdeD (DUF308 family)